MWRLITGAVSNSAQSGESMQHISFEKFTLGNGLDVILHQDNELPIVSVNIWYHVGSKDESLGKTGYAHLFEHLMFEGSKHHNSSHFDPLQKVGATLNGSTTTDRTNYWENLPSNYLELALWLESDRMGFLLDALDQQRFDIQRDVVKNERRQSYENRPYGLASIALQEAIYPLPHPYHWPTIGYHEDLDIATLDDAKEFFGKFYNPSNASLAIAGDIDIAAARDMVVKYFGDLAPGTSVGRVNRLDSALDGFSEITLYDNVLLPKLFLAWPTVPKFHADEAPLAVLGSILGSGKSSRLYKELVYQGRVAQTVGSAHSPSEIAGEFYVEVTAAVGRDQAEIEKYTRDEIYKLCASLVQPEEIERVKNHLEWQRSRQMAAVGGFAGRANRLNSFNVFAGDPGVINSDIERYLQVQPEDLMRVAKRYLVGSEVKMVVLPSASRSRSVVSLDRSTFPSPAAIKPFSPPIPKRQKLQNGLDLLVVEKPGTSAVAFGLITGSGARYDPVELPGLASFTTAMLQEGTVALSSLEIAEAFEFMGTNLSLSTGRERTTIATESLARHFPRALELVSDLVCSPTFPEEELTRLRTERLTGLRRMKDDPVSLAARVYPSLLYGRQSSYGHPVSGTDDSLNVITRQDLHGHFKKFFDPRGSALLVVGDVTIGDVADLAEKTIGKWTNEGSGATDLDDTVPKNDLDTHVIYLLDKPGAAQSVIRVGRLGVPRNHEDYFPLIMVNHLFGGQFTARLNANLRQDKGYSYGYNSSIEWNKTSSLLVAGGAVQTEVTAEAVTETFKEFEDIGNKRPITREEFDLTKAAMLRHLPSSFESPSHMLDQLAQIVNFGLPDSYYSALTSNIEKVSLEDAQRVANNRFSGEGLIMLVVGDAKVIEPNLKEIGVPIVAVDHEGRTLT